MKTSYKIIVAFVSFIVIFLIISMLVLRSNVLTFQTQAVVLTKYKFSEFKDFNKLVFSSAWNVKIRQGKEYKIELSDNRLKAKLINRNRSLVFLGGDSDTILSNSPLHAKVTMPFLTEVKAGQSTSIDMEDFTTDSVQIFLENGSSFKGKNNTIKNLSFKTSGETSLKFITD